VLVIIIDQKKGVFDRASFFTKLIDQLIYRFVLPHLRLEAESLAVLFLSVEQIQVVPQQGNFALPSVNRNDFSSFAFFLIVVQVVLTPFESHFARLIDVLHASVAPPSKLIAESSKTKRWRPLVTDFRFWLQLVATFSFFVFQLVPTFLFFGTIFCEFFLQSELVGNRARRPRFSFGRAERITKRTLPLAPAFQRHGKTPCHP
jgi:hypothetical protein